MAYDTFYTYSALKYLRWGAAYMLSPEPWDWINRRLEDDWDYFRNTMRILSDWFSSRHRAILVSCVFHAVLLFFCTNLISMEIAVYIPSKHVRRRDWENKKFDPRGKRVLLKTSAQNEEPEDVAYHRKWVCLDEFADMMNGLSTDNLTNKDMAGDCCVDDYGLAAGSCGIYGLCRNRTEAAIMSGLVWLKKHQDRRDGRWNGAAFFKNCNPSEMPCNALNFHNVPKRYDVALTGLSVAAFVENRQTHRRGRFTSTVRLGISFLLDSQDAETGCFGNGSAPGAAYNHAFAALAVCEAYAATKDFTLEKPARKAVDYILNCRNEKSGWGYGRKDGYPNTSVTGCMVLALDAARKAGIDVPADALEGATAWIDRVTSPDDGGVGCRRIRSSCPGMGKCNNQAMTAVGVLTRILCSGKKDDPEVAKGADLICKAFTRPKMIFVRGAIARATDYHLTHFTIRAMSRIGGRRWYALRDTISEDLVASQEKGKGCASGSWEPLGRWGHVGGRIYTTAINVMTLGICRESARRVRLTAPARIYFSSAAHTPRR